MKIDKIILRITILILATISAIEILAFGRMIFFLPLFYCFIITVLPPELDL
jgi:hypothetical protein